MSCWFSLFFRIPFKGFGNVDDLLLWWWRWTFFLHGRWFLDWLVLDVVVSSPSSSPSLSLSLIYWYWSDFIKEFSKWLSPSSGSIVSEGPKWFPTKLESLSSSESDPAEFLCHTQYWLRLSNGATADSLLSLPFKFKAEAEFPILGWGCQGVSAFDADSEFALMVPAGLGFP